MSTRNSIGAKRARRQARTIRRMVDRAGRQATESWLERKFGLWRRALSWLVSLGGAR